MRLTASTQNVARSVTVRVPIKIASPSRKLRRLCRMGCANATAVMLSWMRMSFVSAATLAGAVAREQITNVQERKTGVGASARVVTKRRKIDV
jgi:hypothetical protein